MQLLEWLQAERGRYAGLAAYLKVPASLLSRVAAGKKPVPLRWCPHIQVFTEGAVTCEELLPADTEWFSLVRSCEVRAHAAEPAVAEMS